MRGRAHVFDRSTITLDEILPERHAVTDDERRLAAHLMAGADPEFAARVQKGDIIVAAGEFGAGAGREHAVWALRGARVGAVVARSFGRGFYRDALNNGLLVVECAAAAEGAEDGDLLEVDLKDGVVRNLTRGTAHRFVPIAPFAMEILEAGGLLPYVLRQTTGASSA